MIEKSRLMFIITVVAVCIASPAFAQSFDSSDGTGNSLPTYYGPHGGLHRGTATQNERVIVRQNGLNAFAMVPRSIRFDRLT